VATAWFQTNPKKRYPCCAGVGHRAWWIGAAGMSAFILLRRPLGGTPAWLAFTEAMPHIGG